MFLYVAYNAPHYPMHAPLKYVDRFPDLSPDRRIMAAMLSAMDDGVGEICAELVRQGMWEDTAISFMSDNGPSRETRNWLDGRTDPYYGGSAGKLKGHKFSLYEGGIRVPGIVTYPALIPAGQVTDLPAAAMDLFPTFLRLAGGDPAAYELDGTDLLPALAHRAAFPERDLFWEMGAQTAVRRGPWKLVLNGQLVEAAPPEDDVHLADLDDDMAERRNLADRYPELTAELSAAAEQWRTGIELRWQDEWLPHIRGTTTHPQR
jgi:arylsulfatase A-like enzyme